jgi:hypothetical protein
VTEVSDAAEEVSEVKGLLRNEGWWRSTVLGLLGERAPLMGAGRLVVSRGVVPTGSVELRV